MDTQMRDWQASSGEQRDKTRPQWLAERRFRRGDAPAIRRFAQAFGMRTGLRGGLLSDFVLAVNEAAACTTECGQGTARVRLWLAGVRAYCEVRGDGPMLRRTAPGCLPGARPGEENLLRRRVLRQVSDYVCVASGPDGVRVLVTMTTG